MTRLLSLNELARKVDCPYARLLKMVRSGEILPDGVSGRFLFFDERRLDQILTLLKARRLAKLRSPVT